MIPASPSVTGDCEAAAGRAMRARTTTTRGRRRVRMTLLQPARGRRHHGDAGAAPETIIRPVASTRGSVVACASSSRTRAGALRRSSAISFECNEPPRRVALFLGGEDGKGVGRHLSPLPQSLAIHGVGFKRAWMFLIS